MRLAKKDVIKEHIRIAIKGVLAEGSPFDTFLHCSIANEMLYERRSRERVHLPTAWQQAMSTPEWHERRRAANALYNWLKHDNKEEEEIELDFDPGFYAEMMILACILRYEIAFGDHDPLWKGYLLHLVRNHPNCGVKPDFVDRWISERGL